MSLALIKRFLPWTPKKVLKLFGMKFNSLKGKATKHRRLATIRIYCAGLVIVVAKLIRECLTFVLL